MRVMVVTPYLPHSRVGHGGGTAVRDLVKHLALQNEVLLVSLVRSGETQAIAEVEELGVQVLPIPFLDSTSPNFFRWDLVFDRAKSWWRSLFSGYPLYVEKYWSKEISRRILAITSEFAPDAIQIEYLQMSLFARDLHRWRHDQGANTPQIILNTHELGSIPRHRRALQSGSILDRWLSRKEAKQWELLQIEASKWADHTLCVTPEDHLAYEALGGINLLTVPLGMDLEAVQPDRRPESTPICLFVGSFRHRPNVLAAELLVKNIWPQVRAQRPEAKLVLAGRGSAEFLNRQKSDHKELASGISALGFVDDLAPLFRRCKLFVAPLPEGGGIKIKILEAMARGIPVVTTQVGAEGIAETRDDVMVICDHGDGFSRAILLAMDDPKSEERALKARKLMEEKFSWKAITQQLMGIYRAKK